MDKDWNKRPFRPVFRFGNNEGKNRSSIFSPYDLGVYPPKIDLPLPNKIAGGSSAEIGPRKEDPMWYWHNPASPVSKPRGKK